MSHSQPATAFVDPNVRHAESTSPFRNFSDSKPKISRAGNSLTSCIEDACTDKKRKAVALTVDNADDVFAECFDFNAFMTLLDRNPNALHDRDLIHSFMKASVIDSKVSTMPDLTLTCCTCVSCRCPFHERLEATFKPFRHRHCRRPRNRLKQNQIPRPPRIFIE